MGRGTAYSMAARGELPAVRIGRSLRIRRDKLIEWLESRTA
jgi:excisionase family DNA binding protein